MKHDLGSGNGPGTKPRRLCEHFLQRARRGLELSAWGTKSLKGLFGCGFIECVRERFVNGSDSSGIG